MLHVPFIIMGQIARLSGFPMAYLIVSRGLDWQKIVFSVLTGVKIINYPKRYLIHIYIISYTISIFLRSVRTVQCYIVLVISGRSIEYIYVLELSACIHSVCILYSCIIFFNKYI